MKNPLNPMVVAGAAVFGLVFTSRAELQLEPASW